MNLGLLNHRLNVRLSRAEALFKKFSPSVKKTCTHEQVAFLDGLLSYTWQSWGRFCRDLLIHSCCGAHTKAGMALPPVVAPSTVERVSYLAIQAHKKKPVAPAMTNSVWRFEPTWGDVAIFTKLATAIAPANQAQLISAFGGITRGPAHLQKVRNASAHMNDQSFAEVMAIQVYYLGAPIRFPSEASFWLDAANGDFAFIAWLDEMRHVAATAV